MKMIELQNAYLAGKLEKKLYWTVMREQYTHILAEMQEMLASNKECRSIQLTKNGCILEKESGLKLYFSFADAISRAEMDLLNASDPEKSEMDLVNAFIQRTGCTTVFDIGANVGMYSLELWQKHKEVNYYIFEPIPTTYEKLLKTIDLNSAFSERMHTYNLGMSDRTGSFDFYLPGASSAASLQPITDDFYLKKSNQSGSYTGSKEMEKVACQLTTLDSFVKENGIDKIDFIKIDVEGNEKFVLEGGKETLEKYRPLVYTELLRKHAKRFGYHPNDVIDFMKRFDYACFAIREGSLTEVDRIEETTEETNFFFLCEKFEPFYREYASECGGAILRSGCE